MAPLKEHILDGADASDLSPRHKFMFQIWGMVLISYTLGKAYTVLGHQVREQKRTCFLCAVLSATSSA